ncbi:MAG: EAL domain-containing protein [Thiobacillaceae bacterium]|jgi:diguanylate cyclase (GGDEF)-like protein/PAS domain S-box-containing protein
MKLLPSKLGLRNRFLLAAISIQAIVLAALVFNSVRLIDQTMEEQARADAQEDAEIMAATITAPLAERNMATLRSLVSLMEKEPNFNSVVVRDEEGQVLVKIGPRMEKANVLVAGKVPVKLGTRIYGWVEYEYSGGSINGVRTSLIHQSVGIGLLALLGTSLLLLLSGYWISRHFQTLSHMATRIADGDFSARAPVWGQDEVGRIAEVFNQLAQTVEDSVKQAKDDEARFLAIADYTYDLELWLSPEGRLLWVNPSVERMLGYTVAECMGAMNFPLDVIHPDDRVAAEFQLRQALKGHSGSGYVFQMLRKDGSRFWASANWQAIYDSTGRYLGLRASIRDIDDLKNVEASLRQAVTDLRTAENLKSQYLEESEQERARLSALLSAMSLGILFVNPEGRVVYHNPAFTRMWMIPEEEHLVGLDVNVALTKSPNQLARPDHFSRHLLAVLESRETTEGFEIQMNDGRVFTELDYPVRDKEARFIGHLWIYEDVTKERQTAEQLVYLAERDPLTGLFNRHRFQSELDRTMLECRRHESRAAVMFFDLDEFKAINDTFGHRAGDAVLIRVAGEISALVRRNEVFARLGGDEFAILLPSLKGNEAEILAERVVRAVAQIPFRFDGQNLRLTASLGIATYPEQAADAEELVARADIAMYQAKQAGKNTWRTYRDDDLGNRETLARLNWNERISHALDKQGFVLHYQGIYHTSDSTLAHLEALVRMVDERHPDKLIPPGNFIPLAEKSGRIVDIDRWVIRKAVQELARSPKVPAIAVNVSARSLGEPTLSQYIAEQLREFRVDATRLIIELTETDAVGDLHDTQRLIDALRNMGCGVCLDDFGTGFSSFAYLKHLHANILKIDGLFIRDLHRHQDNQVFVQAIVNIARGLGKKVVAEYVESQNVLKILKTFGVDMVQGYHLDMPVADHPSLNRSA